MVVPLTLVLEVVSWVAAVVLAYAALGTRLTVLEDRYQRLQQDVDEIKQDVKALLSHADQAHR